MLTYALENRGTDTLYEYLYKQIKTDILSKKLVAGERLPSKRLLAKNLDIYIRFRKAVIMLRTFRQI